MVGRTISYGTPELLARFADMCDASGLRSKAKLVVGGMSIRKEMAQELGYDAGFGPDTTPDEVADFVDGIEGSLSESSTSATKPDLTRVQYDFRDSEVGELCLHSKDLLAWANARTSPGVKRAEIREEIERARKRLLVVRK